MASLGSLLPKPKNVKKSETSQDDEPSSSMLDMVRQKQNTSNIPPYGQRKGWTPKSQQDFGDGGAYPECLKAQYPLNMGLNRVDKNKAVDVKYDSEGNVQYDALARRGHDSNQHIHSSYKDLIPLRNQANSGELSLDKPTDAEVEQTTEDTREALDRILGQKLEKSRPRHVAKRPDEPTLVRYTPAAQMGEKSAQQRIIRVQDYEQDPLAPPRFKKHDVPDQPPSPPPPQLHEQPRKPTAEERADWYIPPAVSNWKNPMGFTVAIDKRAAADGRTLHDTQINDKKASFAEALYNAEVDGRKSIRERAAMQQKLAEKESAAKEEELRELAKQARRERRQPSSTEVEEEEREPKVSDHESDEDETEESRKRAQARKERQQEREKDLRRSRMGTEQRVKQLAREQNRDISEKVALGLAKPSAAGNESMFDQRLYHQSRGGGYSEDRLYDKSLFAGREAINNIYKVRGSGINEDTDADRIDNESRFEALGKAKQGFKGADQTQGSEGPVEFEKDIPDPHGVNELINDVKYGLDEEGPSRKKQKQS